LKHELKHSANAAAWTRGFSFIFHFYTPLSTRECISQVQSYLEQQITYKYSHDINHPSSGSPYDVCSEYNVHFYIFIDKYFDKYKYFNAEPSMHTAIQTQWVLPPRIRFTSVFVYTCLVYVM